MARSDNWRINKSGIMAVEGAQILKALQKVAGAAGLPSEFNVKFSTKAKGSGISFDDNELVIGAGRLFHEAPILSDKFDVLVGLVLHEVEHYLIETGHLWDMLGNRQRPTLGINNEYKLGIFQKFVNIGEDIVVESSIARNTNLTDYQNTLYGWMIPQMREAQPNKLLELWVSYALAHKVDGLLDLMPEMNDPMSQLTAFTAWLRHIPSYTDRFQAYIKYWVSLKDIILNPPELQSDKTADQQDDTGKSDSTDSPELPKSESPSNSEVEDEVPENPEQSDEAAGTTEAEDSTSELEDKDGLTDEEEELDTPSAPKSEDDIDDKLAEAIEDAIQSESDDITDQVSKEFSDAGVKPNYRQPMVIRSRETKTPLIKPDPTLCKRLERIMTIRKRLQSRTMRGEQYGRIDKRHLHRISADARIFSLKYKFPDGFPNTRILIDLSGSMSGREADEVLQAAGALQTLVNAEVWCYNENGKAVNLVRMDDGKLMHHFEPDGGTPSGLAIVGVSMGMKQGGLVIHLTDGGHNVGQTPWNANWILKGRGIELLNLIWGRNINTYNYDGMNWRQLSGLAEFPDALYQILVEQVKLSKIGGR